MEPRQRTTEPGPGPAAAGASYGAAARQGIVRGGTAALGVLEKVVPIAARLVTLMNVYSWIVIAASAVIVVLGAVLTRPVTAGSLIPFLVAVALLVVPCVTLRLFHGALVEVLAMPDWLRGSPDLVRTHGGELAQIAAAASTRNRDRLWSVPKDIFRSGRLLMRAHGDLPEYGRMMRLVSVPFLFVVLVSFLAGFMVIAFAMLLVLTTPIALALR